MVTMQTVQDQFKRLGFRPGFFARGEIRELPNILMPEEELTHVVMGWYDGGLALLCATNHRIILIDKKPFFLTVEDLRYNMIAEVRYQHRLLDANVRLNYPAKSLDFKSWDQRRLRGLVSYVQEAIIIEKKHEETAAEESPQPVSTLDWRAAPAPSPSQYYQPMQTYSLPKNPYQVGRQLLRRNKVSRFITQSQLSR